MADKLKQLTKLKRELDTSLLNYQRNHALWAKWLHWAKKQPWYDNWAYEQAMKQSDLKADSRKIAKKYRDVEPIYKENIGAIYFSERHSFHSHLEQLRLKRSVLLHELWVASDGTNFVYSLEEIANAYGVSQDAMYKKMVINSWFFTRRSAGQRVISRKHLKTVKDT